MAHTQQDEKSTQKEVKCNTSFPFKLIECIKKKDIDHLSNINNIFGKSFAFEQVDRTAIDVVWFFFQYTQKLIIEFVCAVEFMACPHSANIPNIYE